MQCEALLAEMTVKLDDNVLEVDSRALPSDSTSTSTSTEPFDGTAATSSKSRAGGGQGYV